jgi:hypothetical protein
MGVSEQDRKVLLVLVVLAGATGFGHPSAGCWFQAESDANVDDLRRRLNEYLFCEFGMDLEGDESAVSTTWPFELREGGRTADLIVFEFEDDQPYFALASPSLNYLPKAGMTFDDLVLQDAGSRWIGARDPIDLSMSKPGDDAVPSGMERRRALEELGATTMPGRHVEILTGLFLRTDRRYLALLREAGASEALVVGIPSAPNIVVGFPEASAWRRLAWAVGRSIRG